MEMEMEMAMTAKTYEFEGFGSSTLSSDEKPIRTGI